MERREFMVDDFLLILTLCFSLYLELREGQQSFGFLFLKFVRSRVLCFLIGAFYKTLMRNCVWGNTKRIRFWFFFFGFYWLTPLHGFISFLTFILTKVGFLDCELTFSLLFCCCLLCLSEECIWDTWRISIGEASKILANRGIKKVTIQPKSKEFLTIRILISISL